MASRGKKPRSTRSNRFAKSERDKDVAVRSESSLNRISRELQQKCLDLFRDATKPSAEDEPILQEVKGHLYNRDFATTFGKEEYLRAYASRWSPSRALAYLQIFTSLDISALRPSDEQQYGDDGSTLNVVCLGGGAGSELVALAAWLRARRDAPSTKATEKLEVRLVDLADWSYVVAALGDAITTPPELSKYASQAKKEANTALLDASSIDLRFEQADVLDLAGTSLPQIVATADLVTFMFTLNELYSTSMPKTQKLLSNTLNNMQEGSHLLVVDSPGSYSTISINGAEKKYPMIWLLEYTLLGDPRSMERGDKWERIMSDDSRWFRMPDGLQYPIELENMRYQIHLYRKIR